MNAEIDVHEKKILLFLLAKFGNRTKALISVAWQSGDYSDLGIDSADVATLQQLRNTRGPSWLFGLKWNTVRQSEGGAA